jgi:hypothetical protein
MRCCSKGIMPLGNIFRLWILIFPWPHSGLGTLRMLLYNLTHGRMEGVQITLYCALTLVFPMMSWRSGTKRAVASQSLLVMPPRNFRANLTYLRILRKFLPHSVSNFDTLCQ